MWPFARPFAPLFRRQHFITSSHTRRVSSSSSSKEPDPTRLRVYTRTGDKGVTSTFSGQRFPKDDEIFEALGASDELSSCIGLAREFCLEAEHHDVTELLQEVQCVLQDVGSHVATPRDTAKSTPQKISKTGFSESHVLQLEQWIDLMDTSLPPLTVFILPSGGKSSAALHVARTICRRAERRVVPLYRSGKVEHPVAKYLNRLSDFLFTAARYVALKEGKEEVVYKSPQ